MVLIEDAMEDAFNNDNMSIGLDKLFAILDEPPSQGFQQPNPPSSRLNSVKNPVKSEMQPEVPVIDLNSPPPDVLSNEYMSCISDSSMDSSPTSDYIVPAQSVVDDDDDDDICVLDDDDDVGHPVLPPPPPVAAATKAYHNTSQHYGSHHHASPNYVSRHHASQNYGAEQYGSGVARPNADDERLTYRAVLQDLSQPTSEAIPPDGLLAVPLLKHQRIALSWMVQKETASFNCCGGILADDQGLGKTISTISLILTERSPPAWSCSLKVKHEEFEPLNLDDDDDDDVAKRPRGCGPVKRENSDGMELKGRPAGGTLVVCPTSVLRQWNEELHNKVTRDANLSVLIYHGSKRTKDPCELARYDVVLTTYAIVGMEVPKQPPAEGDDSGWPVTVKKRKQSSSSDAENHKGRKKKVVNTVVPRALARVGWFRVVLDEAQMIKNYRTQVARACWGIRAKRRWCLSGTPIQNSIDDLYSYFRFLRFDPYAVYASFRLKIKGPILGNPTKGYKKLQAVLKTILLRRTKETLLDGKPIITLPPKTITLKKLDFSKEERIYYERLEGDFREQFKEYADAGTIEQNYVNILLMLLRLRQACGHPLLVGGFDADSAWRLTKEMAKKPPKDKQMDLLRCLEASVAICAICNDAPEDAVVTICGHVFCNQCIREHLTEDDNICPSASCRVQLTADSVFSKGELKGSPSSEWGRGCSGSGPEMVRKPVSYRGDLSCDSTKVKAAVEILRSLPTCSNGQVTEKAIVFSQWTKMLDLLEVPLTNSSVQYRRLDGTMSVADRDIAVKEFNTLPQVTVMLMSLKAASLGLNMVAACHVVLLDLWWNPTTEDQAIDRAHRIGQTRPVTVSRFTVTGTVEDRILALQQKKREMVASAFGEEPGGRHTRLTVDDLKYLFMV